MRLSPSTPKNKPGAAVVAKTKAKKEVAKWVASISLLNIVIVHRCCGFYCLLYVQLIVLNCSCDWSCVCGGSNSQRDIGL